MKEGSGFFGVAPNPPRSKKLHSAAEMKPSCALPHLEVLEAPEAARVKPFPDFPVLRKIDE